MADKKPKPEIKPGIEIGNVLKPLESLKQAAKARKSSVITK
jgi:hypothetical protein